MMSTKSPKKGKRGELKISKILFNKLGIKFKRTPQSGGSCLKQDKKLAGDLVTSDPRWKYSIEVKTREDWKIEDFLNPVAKCWMWWDQACKDASVNKLEPVLICTKSYHKPIVISKVRVSKNLGFVVEHNKDIITLTTLDTWIESIGRDLNETRTRNEKRNRKFEKSTISSENSVTTNNIKRHTS